MFETFSQLSSAFRAPPLPAKRVLIVNGHPDPNPERYCAALCAAYAKGAETSGVTVRRLDVGKVTLPGRASWMVNEASDVLEELWLADRVFMAFPMWLGGAPPALALVLEEFARWQEIEAAQLDEPIDAKEAHIAVTASFPGLVYRTNLGVPLGAWAKSLACLRVSASVVIGNVETMSLKHRCRWLGDVRRLGASRLGGDSSGALLGSSR